MSAPEDPREFSIFVAEQINQGNWEAVRPLLVEEFREFSSEVLARTIRVVSAETAGPQLEDWTVEEYDHFTIVRLTDQPLFAFVLRDVNGNWRLDPGPRALALARMFDQYPEASGWGTPPDYQKVQSTVPDEMPIPIFAIYTDRLEAIVPNEDSIDVAFQWTFTRQAEGELPLGQLSWQAGDERGPVEVTWTTAKLGDEKVNFPQPVTGEFGRLDYDIAFKLIDVPDVDQVKLHINGLSVRMPDEEPFTVSSTHTIPVEPHPIPTEVRTPPVSVTPLPDAEVPDVQAESPRFEVIDVETTVEGERIDVEINVQAPGEERIELLADPLVHWSDGETTTAQNVGSEPFVLNTTRQSVPEGVVPSEIIIPALSRSLPSDDEAVVDDDIIQTKWGTFQLGELTEQPAGRWSTTYQPSGLRWIDAVVIPTSEGEVGASGRSISFRSNFEGIEYARLDFDANFDEIRDELPLKATAHVREFVKDVRVPLPESDTP